MSDYSSPTSFGFDIDFADDGLISISQSRMHGMGGTDESIILDTRHAEQLVEKLGKFLEDLKSGRLSPPTA